MATLWRDQGVCWQLINGDHSRSGFKTATMFARTWEITRKPHVLANVATSESGFQTASSAQSGLNFGVDDGWPGLERLRETPGLPSQSLSPAPATQPPNYGLTRH